MRIEKKDINVFLALWIRNHKELWEELRDIQIKILVQRIVKEMSFEQLEAAYNVPEQQLRKIFRAIVVRIYHFIDKEAALYIGKLNERLDNVNAFEDEWGFPKIMPN